ncbi:MAG TPA: lycopene cyclase family protein [Rubrobacteraceae bacterium]|nr:lycopene cyclase family protein [Rubrobacteraceae bacterium]
MSASTHDMVFVGGGLSALLLLNELRTALPGRVAVVDPAPLLQRPLVHWSYWSHGQTPYDRFTIGSWRQARVGDKPPESIAPFILRLVRSTDVLAHLTARLESAPIEWLHTSARSVARRDDEAYEVVTDDGILRANWVFDSVCDIAPVFPSPRRPRAVQSGTGVHITADRPIFDPATVTLFDPLDERSFAYVLPLSSVEALVESASFGPVALETGPEPLLRYLRTRYPGADFRADHVEFGSIPLGFAPSRTAGPQHVLIGTKRGLIKPSAGYGVVRIARESEHLARLWREERPTSPGWWSDWRWRLLDMGFLQIAAQDPHRPLALLHDVMHAVPLAQSLRFIDEDLPLRQLATVFRAAVPAVLGKPR